MRAMQAPVATTAVDQGDCSVRHALDSRRPRSYGALKHRVLRAHADRSAQGVAQFVVRTGAGVIPEGHERLTREAAAGITGVSAADVRALVEGVRRPDTESLRNHVLPDQQRRHALRATLGQPLAAALRDARMHLAALHGRALGAGSRQAAFLLIGEALHLIQDSYAPAHVQRLKGAGGRHPITYIRYFGPNSGGAPLEHGFPFDPRDLVAEVTGGLKPWSLAAVAASREFLWLMQRHLARPRAARNAEELRTFLDRHLVLSRNHIGAQRAGHRRPPGPRAG